MGNAKQAPGYTPNPDYTQEDWDEVSDNPELTAEDFAAAQPVKEALPGFYAAAKRLRGKQKAPVKKPVSIRLDEAVIADFKSGGPGWQSRINAALHDRRRAVSLIREQRDAIRANRDKLRSGEAHVVDRGADVTGRWVDEMERLIETCDAVLGSYERDVQPGDAEPLP